MKESKTRDFLERLVWTFVVTTTTTTIGNGILGLDLELWKMAALQGVGAVIQSIVLLARYRLSMLPSPGEGLPGLPTREEVTGAEGQPRLPGI